MPTTAMLKLAETSSAKYAEALVRVMGNLESGVVAIMAGAKAGTGAQAKMDAATVLNSRPAFIQALHESGYNDLAADYVATYGAQPEAVGKAFASRSLPKPEYSTVSVDTFKGLARVDLEVFAAIGEKAMDDLRIGLYKSVISGQPFKQIVDQVREATTGLDKAGSPLSKYAYTHANTALLSFQGEVLREAGESIGAEKWEVVGPDDQATRAECQDALADPIRTAEEWQAAGYWGGTPGGWN